jgi:hypothetical protein
VALRTQAGDGVFDGARELRQVAARAVAAAVRRHLEQHRLQAGRGERGRDRQHVRGIAAPAVHQQHHRPWRRAGRV